MHPLREPRFRYPFTVLLALSTGAYAHAEERTLCYRATVEQTAEQKDAKILQMVGPLEERSLQAASQLTCEYPTIGNYLYDNPSDRTYVMTYADECDAIQTSMRKHPDSIFLFKVDTRSHRILKVTRKTGEDCLRYRPGSVKPGFRDGSTGLEL